MDSFTRAGLVQKMTLLTTSLCRPHMSGLQVRHVLGQGGASLPCR